MENKKKIIIFDLDGTLANIDHRRHFVTKPELKSENLFEALVINPVKEAEWKPDWKAFYEACVDDSPNTAVILALQMLGQSIACLNGLHNIEIPQRFLSPGEAVSAKFAEVKGFIQIWSGREQSVEEQTRAWLRKYQIGLYSDYELRMRPIGDYTPDEELKERWLMEVGVENVLMVFDDRDKVVKMWRRHGIPCFQVAEGNF